MSNIKRYLDNNTNANTNANTIKSSHHSIKNNISKSEIEITKRPIINQRIMCQVVNSINSNYDLYNTDPLVNHLFNNIRTIPRKLIIKKEKIIINREINSLNDLIKLLDDYPLVPNAKYNIDMTTLHPIKDLLIELNNMIGLHEIKNNILDQILFYAQNLHLNNGIDYMHTVLYGCPGTGKTDIAKIIGKIFCKLGILKNGIFRKVVRSDLIAGYLGQTAIKTSKVIEETLGGVLFIDEAYALGNAEKRDSFSKECIDTLCEALSNHKNELMVIIAGYDKELNDCFFNYNQGLKSRFPWVFKTDKYVYDDLKNIFIKKINDINWKIEIDNNVHDDFFKTNMDLFSYYGRDMETLLLKCKIAHGRRIFCKPNISKMVLTIEDLEKGLELFKKHRTNNNKDDDDDKNIIYTMYN